MQRFFEPKADSLWPAATPPVHKAHELAARSNIESPALPAAAAGRRLSSFFEVMNLAKGKWCPAMGSNESRSPSTNSSSSADSMNSFDSSAVLTHQDSDDFQLQSPIEAYPAILFPVVDQRRSFLSMDEALLKPHDASSLKVTPNRRKESSMSDERKSIGALPRVQKRKRTDPILSALEESNSPTSKLFMPTQPMLKASTKKNQKLGDKVTALQQLVSPFGKTDTASVLHEATVYIKALHEQIDSLSKPYLESIYSEGIQGSNMGHGERCSSLRAIGLCIVPTSSAVVIFGG